MSSSSLRAARRSKTPQDDAQATYAPKILKTEGPIDWSLPAVRIHNLVRGLQPWPLASTTVDGSRGPDPSDVPSPVSRAMRCPAPSSRRDGIRLPSPAATASLEILEIQPEGRRAMTAREFLSGHKVALDTRLPS